jgi:hypothetical protein
VEEPWALASGAPLSIVTFQGPFPSYRVETYRNKRIKMGEYKSMGGDCMSWARKRCRRGRFGFLLIVIGLLWFGQRAGWFPPEIFGPLVLLTLGVWMIVTSYLQKRQAPQQSRTSNEGLANRNEE